VLLDQKSVSGLQEHSQGAVQACNTQARCTDFLREWLPSRLLERLFQMTAAISRHVLAGASMPEAAFPRLPGSHLSPQELGTPALAFVRTVCHVLALDTSVELEVSIASCPNSPHVLWAALKTATNSVIYMLAQLRFLQNVCG
jgi:hypothetical protein